MNDLSPALHKAIRRPRMLTSAVFALALFALLFQVMAPVRALLLAFNTGTGIYLVLMARLMQRATPAAMHHRARLQEDGKWVVLAVSLGVALVVLSALAGELHAAKAKSIGDIVLVACSIFTAWVFVALVFAQHYAHSYYMAPGQLAFPGTENPDYWDFTYFAVVISMCCQTSDVGVTSGAMRRLVTLHSVVSFFFNVVIIAISVNVAVSVL
jgi:uncharacterized membrane protein